MKTKLKYLLILGFIHIPILMFAQQILIKGVVLNTDSTENCCAIVRIKGSKIQTSANDSGHFQLILSEDDFEKSSKILFVGKIGYKFKELELSELSDSAKMDLKIILEEEIYIIDEVLITNPDNPANRFIKEAIKNRKKHLNENIAFQAHVYLKGLQKLKKLPEKVLGFDTESIANQLLLDSNRTGIVYLSESESIIWSQPPNRFKEEVVKSRVSGNNRSFSFNRASDLQLNFYENSYELISGISPRPFISPISDYAFQYYNYKYLGFSEENGYTLNKIEVIPKRKGEPLMKGVIYLLEGEGRIVGVDLEVDPSFNLQFVNTLKISQQFFEEDLGLWYSSGANLYFDLEFLGVQIEGNYMAYYSDYQKIDEAGNVNFREKLKIQYQAVENDSTYWNKYRPIPLQEEELRDYQVKDSVRLIRESPAYLDSIDREFNKFKVIPFLLNGYSFRNREHKIRGEIAGLINSLNFNLVEGINIQYGMGINKTIDSLYQTVISLQGKVRYGWHNKRFNPSVKLGYNKPGFNKIFLSMGRDMVDFNRLDPYPEWINSAYIIFGGYNYFKLYERTFVNIEKSINLPLNSVFHIELFYNRRNFLENIIEYSFVNSEQRRFTSNLPGFLDAENNVLENHHNMGVEVKFQSDFSTQYHLYPTGKRYLTSDFPLLSLNAKWASNSHSTGNNSHVYLGVGIEKNRISLKRWGRISYKFHYGKFLKDPLYLPDFAHLTTGNFLISKNEISSFLTLDRYAFASNHSKFEGHIHYNLGTIITSKLPLIRNLSLQEVLNFHYLSSEKIEHFMEVNAGFSKFGFQLLYAHPLYVLGNKFELPISKHAIRLSFGI